MAQFDYERFAQIHKKLVEYPHKNNHLTLFTDIELLVNTYKECGGGFDDDDKAPWFTLVAYVYALQERLGLPMIMHMNSLVQNGSINNEGH